MDKVTWIFERGIPYVLVILLSILVLVLSYFDNKYENNRSRTVTPSETIEGIFDGYNLCMKCDLGISVNGTHDCDKTGHSPVFKITRVVDISGNLYPELCGKTLRYNVDQLNLELLSEFRGEYSRLKGVIHLDNETVAIKSIRKIDSSGKRFKSPRGRWLVSQSAPLPRSGIAFI